MKPGGCLETSAVCWPASAFLNKIKTVNILLVFTGQLAPHYFFFIASIANKYIICNMRSARFAADGLGQGGHPGPTVSGQRRGEVNFCVKHKKCQKRPAITFSPSK
jgi:hypothetical protein